MPDYATTNYPTATRRGSNSKTTLMRAAIGPGEIVQVQGGHIIRATGRKDRHSKVYTAKGPRDRRVRLSAHTAIQFYDVQDRLGYDRPSKAVDWLIKKAKDAIDKLDHLPPFNPTRTPPLALEYPSNHLHHNEPLVGGGEEEEDLAMVEGREGNGCHSESSGYESIHQQIQHHHQQIGNGGGDGSRAAGLSLDSSNTSMVADTMRSFFPTSSSEHGQMNSIGFHQSYDPNTHTARHHQDLGLSLHSFSVDPVAATSHTSFPSGFESTGSHDGWGVDQNHQQQQSEMGRFSRLLAWSCGSGGGFGSSPPQGVVVGNNSPAALLFGDRETLQSSFSHPQHQQSSIRAWDDLPPPMERQHHAGGISDHGFMAGFCIPEIQHHGINLPNKYNNTDNKTSSMSTDSSH